MSDEAGRIRALREQRGWTQRDLAEKAGVSRDSVRRAEEGQPVRAVTVRRIMLALADSSDVEVVIFNVLADHTSDLDYIDEVSTKLVAALRDADLLR